MIDFIEARNGGIAVYDDGMNELGWACDANELGDLIIKHGVDEYAADSSSMDFADEYGFDYHGDAWELWNEAIELYEEEHLNANLEETYHLAGSLE